MPGDHSVPFFVITRAGVSLDGAPVDEDWLRLRAEIFRTYFVPAVNAQTDQDFTLLVCFDRSVSETIVEDFTRTIACRFEVVKTGHPWMDAVTERFARRGEIITATCDSDDALARDYVEVARRSVRPDRALNFQQVVRYSPQTGRFAMKPKLSNPFILRHSSIGEWVLQEDGVHGTVAQVVPTDDVWFPPMGLQVVHGRNVYNKTWPYVPPLPAGFVRARFAVDFPKVRTPREHRADLVRYLLDPRGFLLLIRRKGLRAAVRTLLRS